MFGVLELKRLMYIITYFYVTTKLLYSLKPGLNLIFLVKDRESSLNSKVDGGGVMIAVSTDIVSHRLCDWESGVEDIWIRLEIKINGKVKNIFMCAVYLPPRVKQETLSSFLNHVNNVMSHCDDVVVLGDFNLGFIQWRQEISNTVPSNYASSLGYSLVDFLSLNNFSQLNSFVYEDGRILDLILTNLPGSSVSKPLTFLSKLDGKYPNLQLNLNYNDIQYLNSKPTNVLNFYKSDYEKIKARLDEVNWQENCFR